MKVSSKTVTCLFCFMFIAELGASLNCTTSCGNRGVDIRFPFWIKERQPDQCGYPGFALSCNERGDIVLELPPAGKLHIEKIDYKNQTSKLASLSTVHYDALAVDSELSIEGKESLLSCTKMYDLPVPRDIRLSWSSPNCGSCEATGKQCRLRKNSITELETECVMAGTDKTKISYICCEVPDKWVTCTWKKRLAIGVTTGSILFGILVIAVYQIHSFRKSEEEYQAKVERFLDDYRAMNPTRYMSKGGLQHMNIPLEEEINKEEEASNDFKEEELGIQASEEEVVETPPEKDEDNNLLLPEEEEAVTITVIRETFSVINAINLGIIALNAGRKLHYIADVYYIPAIKHNMLSIGQLLEKGYTLFMKDCHVAVKRQQWKIDCLCEDVKEQDVPTKHPV
ncbi:hypothetical protein DKX38_011804 [Salix brachista]|uniref:RING-type E3 ubiquitin transferase n=1 Tax=Salix brachista TaxID=2182728 RepID=A0A5N5M0E9_9ROSI|nr:hypothetical protein DKX38_011804 [Salix brachista]